MVGCSSNDELAGWLALRDRDGCDEGLIAACARLMGS